MGRSGEGVSTKRGTGGEERIPIPSPTPYFLHSLAVSSPLRAFGNERLLRRLG